MNKKQNLEIHKNIEFVHHYKCEINTLNDDCFIEIFQYLSFYDKVKIEQVSKRWNRLSKLSWSSFHSLTVDYPSINNVDVQHRVFGYEQEFNKIVFEIVSRCRNYLHSLDLTNSSNDPILFDSVAKNCKNLINFSISDTHQCITDNNLELLFLNNNNLEFLSLNNIKIDGRCFRKISSSLKTVHLRNFDMKKSEYFYEFLHHSKNLKNLSLHECSKNIILAFTNAAKQTILNLSEITLYLRCFDYDFEMFYPTSSLLPVFENLDNLVRISLQGDYLDDKVIINFSANSLESLTLDFVDVSAIGMLNFLPRAEVLSELILYHFPINENHAKAISSCRNLKKLHLYILETSELTRTGANYFGKLINLQELSLLYIQDFVDEILYAVSKWENLKTLSINFCYNTTERGLINIFTMLRRNLESLYISNLEQLTDNVISVLKSLKQFHCSDCSKITVEGISQILKNSPNLEVLNLSRCKQIRTKDLIDQVLETVNVRGKNKILYINFDGVKNKNVKILSPFIKVLNN